MSSFSSDLKLELMVTGQNAGTWGDKTNTNLNLVQQAIAGVESVTLSDGGTVALVMSNAALSNARNMVIKFATITLSSASIVTIPDSIEKFYIFDATAVTAATNLTIKTASGSGFTLDASKIYAAYSDGTNLTEVSLDTLGGTIAAAQIATDAVTTAKILQSNVTQNKMAPNAIGTAQILQSQVTLNKMAPNSVGPAQLQSTAVTAGSYTTASITVDEDGRLTAASSGSAGANLFQVTLAESGPASGNFTANPNTNLITAYAGGGGGGHGKTPIGQFVPGGNAAGGFFFFPISQPFGPHPFSVGAGGVGTNNPSSSGTSGGATTLTPSPISAPGGSRAIGTGGPVSPSGNASGQPGNNNTVTTGPAAFDMSQNPFLGPYGFRSTSNNPEAGDGFLVIYENIFS